MLKKHMLVDLENKHKVDHSLLGESFKVIFWVPVRIRWTKLNSAFCPPQGVIRQRRQLAHGDDKLGRQAGSKHYLGCHTAPTIID
jgi:hypothetical protein